MTSTPPEPPVWPAFPGGAVLCAVIAVGSGWYDYRVWTYRTRRLIV